MQTMIKGRRYGHFVRLPDIGTTVIDGNLLLTVRSQDNQKILDEKIDYEQGRDSKIYKRTRLNISPRQMKKWPTSLLLSGKGVFDSPVGSVTSSDVEDIKMVESEQESLPPIEKPSLIEPSKSFYNDFGLKPQSTDTFSGLKNLKKKKHYKSSLHVEKEFEKKAMKHIHAIQVLSNSKRGSHAIRSVNALKETLGPTRSHTEMILPTSYVRSEMNASPDKHASFVDVSKRPPFNMLIRTRDVETKSSNKRYRNSLPEISGTTMLGFETKYNSKSPIKDLS